MVELRLSRLCAAWAFIWVCASLLVAACSTPEFKFVDSNALPAHCQNTQRDEGESDIDCGGACAPCALTQRCNTSADCRNGECIDGTCQACASGRSNCNGDPDDDPAHAGCEIDLKTDVDNCGACGNACTVFGGEAECSAGACSIKRCSPGRADCSGGYADGCETNTDTDLANCGTCANTCTTPNGSPACVSGACRVKTCSGSHADCNGTARDGCETNTSNNQTHCGACTGDSVNCNTLFANASAECVNSACNLSSCATDYFNCDAVASNGCEVNLKTDPNHCGTCAISCSQAGANATYCVSGTCAPDCAGTRIFCSNPEDGCPIDSATDDYNCGGCARVCMNGPGTNLSVDGNHCLAGVCRPSCASSWADCDNNPGNGCERTVASDPANCGGCNVICGTANVDGPAVCTGGSCTPKCVSPWKNCGPPEAGCNVQLGTVDNCKFCGDVCPGTNRYCTPGGCVTHFDIGVVGAGMTALGRFEAAVIPTLSKDHVLTNSKASGRYRIVLVGVTASEPYLTSEFAWYNGTLMHSAIEVNSNERQSYAGIFYLLDDELPPMPGTYPVKVQFSSSPLNGSGAFTAIEFQNVRQTASPFVTTTAAPSDANCSTQMSRAVPLTFTQAGSFGYAVIAARAGTNAMATPGLLVETMNLTQNQPAPLAALAGYAGPINGNTTLSWNVSNCSNTAGVGVVLKRVGD